HAAQAQSRHQRTDLWTSARGAVKRAGRIRERSALARARYIALLRRAHHHPRLNHARRLSPEQDGEFDRDMIVYPERMMANLESTHGLVFSGQLLLDLVESGISREDAYRVVQSHAMRAW